MAKADRLLALLETLQAQPSVTGPALAARLGVDVRTVRRDIVALHDLGIPVEAERGRHGGYRLRPGYKLPPLMLTDDEAVAVALGLIAGDQLGLATEVPATASALAKIQRVLPASLATRLDSLREALGLTLSRRDPGTRPASAVLLALGEAARHRRRVRLAYRSWRGSVSERDLDPYGVVFHAGRWYAAGHDHQSGEVRTFRLDRIAAVEQTRQTFVPPEGFDAVAHVTGSLAAVPYAWQVDVVLETSFTEASRRLPPTVASLTETDGGVLLSARAEDLAGMAALLAGLGWAFTIVRPPELRAAVAAHGQRLLDLANR